MLQITMDIICNGNKLWLALDYLFFKMYDKENFMSKCALRIAKMDKKFSIAATLICLLATNGCYLFRPIDENAEDAAIAATNAPACNINDGPCITPPSETNEYVNYTEVAADYREYGERTPRDQRIVQSSGPSNMAAAIPPTIEEEVTDYEQEIQSTEMSLEETSEVNTQIQGSGEDPVKDWLAEEGQSLKNLLTQWSNESGWRLIWKTNRNYTLSAGAMFRGRFADVSAALVRAFGRARPAPIATFYKGNRVLVIETMEDENAYE